MQEGRGNVDTELVIDEVQVPERASLKQEAYVSQKAGSSMIQQVKGNARLIEEEKKGRKVTLLLTNLLFSNMVVYSIFLKYENNSYLFAK